MAEEGKDPKTFEDRYQGNKSSGGDRPEETEQSGPAAEAAEPTLKFNTVKAAMILGWSPNPNAKPETKCFLIERVRNSGKSTLGWTQKLTHGNRRRALVWMYSYKSHPPAKGTFVVLEFVESGKFIFGCGQATAPRLCVGEPDGDLKDPEDIKDPKDPRVFLKKQTMLRGSTEVVFAWNGYVITLLPNPGKPFGPVGLKPEGNGPVEAQLFQLNVPILRPKSEEKEDHLEPVPYPFPTSDLSEKHHEVQHHDKISSLS